MLRIIRSKASPRACSHRLRVDRDVAAEQRLQSAEEVADDRARRAPVMPRTIPRLLVTVCPGSDERAGDHRSLHQAFLSDWRRCVAELSSGERRGAHHVRARVSCRARVNSIGLPDGSLDQDLAAAGAGDDFAAKMHAGCTEPIDERRQTVRFRSQPVPAARRGSREPVGKRARRRNFRAADSQSVRSPCPTIRERRSPAPTSESERVVSRTRTRRVDDLLRAYRHNGAGHS